MGMISLAVAEQYAPVARWFRHLASWIALGLVLAGFFHVAFSCATTAAQDVISDEETDAAAGADAPAAPAAGAATPSQLEQAAQASPRRRSYLAWLFESLGLMYSVIFLGLSFSLVAVFVMNLLVARRAQILPPGLIEGFERHLEAKQYQEAYELARNDDSFLGKVLSAGLSRLTYGYQPAVEAMQEVGEEESMRLEHLLSYLALIGTISPMFGLLGTVDGMVQAFDVIAQSTVSPKPNELAQGIATALVTTLVGLWLAIPAIAAFNILRNRVSRLVLEVGTVSEGLMRRFQNVGPKKVS
jgi:biopolymer transport protein ExbB